MKRRTILKGMAAASALPLLSGTTLPAFADQRISIGTGGTGGLFYVIGAGMADVINKSMPDTSARAEVTGASIENIRRVVAGQMTFGFSSSSTLFEAKNGQGAFKKPQAVAAMAYLYPAVLQVATLKQTGVKTFGDLAGKSVSLGPPGSNSAVISQRILEAYGVFDKITPQFLSYTEGTNALVNGTVQAASVLAGAPTAALIDLDSQRDMVLIPVEEDKLGDLLEKYPFYQLYEVKKETYSDLEGPVKVINDPATIFTAADADEKLIYDITKTLFTHLKELGGIHPQAKAISLEMATKTPIDLHPGAKKFFDEQSK